MPDADERAPVAPAERPRYQPPRLLRRRSVARVTLASGGFGGSGPTAGGLTGPG
jgi:hypothetical protein